MSNTKKILSKEYMKKKYILVFDDDDQLEIDEETYFKNYIYEKDELSQDFVDQLSLQTEVNKCYRRALGYLLNGKRTENRLKAYLYNKEFSGNAIKKTIEILKKDKKINDAEFIAKFLKINIKPGAKRDKVIAKLIYHGIPQEVAIKEVDKVIKDDQDSY